MDKRCTLYKEEYLNTFNYFHCLYEYYRKVKRCGLGVFANITGDKRLFKGGLHNGGDFNPVGLFIKTNRIYL